MDIAARQRIHLANVGGIDFVDGRKKLVLGVIW